MLFREDFPGSADQHERSHELQRILVNRGLTYLGMGTNRVTYLSQSGKYVYKVPLNGWGWQANRREAELWSKHVKGGSFFHGKLARCKLAPSGILVMELVKTRVHEEDLPEWATYIDCAQVGYNHQGQLVAYDYGDQ